MRRAAPPHILRRPYRGHGAFWPGTSTGSAGAPMKLRQFHLVAGSALTLAGLACGTTSSPPSSLQPGAAGSAAAPLLADTAQQAALRSAPRQSAMPTPDELRQLESLIDSYHQRTPGTRGYLMVDKPMYQPGETIWLRADARADATLT